MYGCLPACFVVRKLPWCSWGKAAIAARSGSVLAWGLGVTTPSKILFLNFTPLEVKMELSELTAVSGQTALLKQGMPQMLSSVVLGNGASVLWRCFLVL